MVRTMAEFLGKTGNQKTRVNYKANEVIDIFIVAKRVMVAFVTNNPNTCEDTTLNKYINNPT